MIQDDCHEVMAMNLTKGRERRRVQSMSRRPLPARQVRRESPFRLLLKNCSFPKYNAAEMSKAFNTSRAKLIWLDTLGKSWSIKGL